MALYVIDVADVAFKRKSDGHIVFTSEAQMSSLSQTVDEEAIQGGIGSKTLYTVKSNKQMELSVRNATFNLEWLAMTQGVKVEDGGVATIMRDYTVDVKTGAVTVDASVTGTVTIVNEDKASQTAEATAGSVTIPAEFAADGESITVIAEEDVVGKSVEIRSDKFSEKYEVQYKTIVYDNNTDTHVHDLFINFYEVSPSSAFDLSLENGTAFTPELTFTAMANKQNEIGKMIQVPVGETP